ncbi:MAG: TolB family protein, partial [Balneolaceae bacterium]
VEIELLQIPANCSVSGENPRSVEVVTNVVSETEFLITCKLVLRDKIAFASDRAGGAFNIYVMNSDGSGVRQLTFNNNIEDRRPVISPDGTKIAFNHGGNVAVMDSDGSNMRTLASVEGKAPLPQLIKSEPSWSPDGSKIAYTVHNTGNNNKDIWVMNADGSGQTPLIADSNQNYWAPDWKPDGSKLIFVSTRVTTIGDDAVTKIVVNDLFWADADGSNIQLFNPNATGNNTNPRWTSDISVTFTSDRDGQEEVYFFVLFGDVALTSGNSPSRWPSGSPDNSRIVFAREGRSGLGGPIVYQIVTISTSTSNPDIRGITGNFFNDVEPHWSPVQE